MSIRPQLNQLVLASFFISLATSIGVAATKDTGAPDREMLKMMDFLRDMEMIQRMEMLQNLRQLESAGEPKTTASQKTPPAKKRETVK